MAEKTKQNKEILIEVKNVYKKFTTDIKRSLLYGSVDMLRDFIGIKDDRGNLRKAEFWALKNISFNLYKGEKLGFLGKNGSGKSTLLRLINGIFPPDKGKITIQGQIGALIAVGAGFHPHMSGRENIYLNGTILGMSRKEIDQKFKDIVEFAEIGKFLDAPVSTYSSGMRVRLGFSIAVHKEPDIMLVDEVLAVGDLSFQLKCQKRLAEYSDKGGTFIIVSHNMQAIRNTCNRVIWLEDGEVVMQGPVEKVCDAYESSQIQRTYKLEKKQKKNERIIDLDENFEIEDVKFLDNKDSVTDEFEIGKKFILSIKYNAKKTVKKPIFTISIYNREGHLVVESYSNKEGMDLSEIKGKGEIRFSIDNFNFKQGVYDISVTVSSKEQLNKIEWHDKAYHLYVTNKKYPVNQAITYSFPEWNQIK